MISHKCEKKIHHSLVFRPFHRYFIYLSFYHRNKVYFFVEQEHEWKAVFVYFLLNSWTLMVFVFLNQMRKAQFKKKGGLKTTCYYVSEYLFTWEKGRKGEVIKITWHSVTFNALPAMKIFGNSFIKRFFRSFFKIIKRTQPAGVS